MQQDGDQPCRFMKKRWHKSAGGGLCFQGKASFHVDTSGGGGSRRRTCKDVQKENKSSATDSLQTEGLWRPLLNSSHLKALLDCYSFPKRSEIQLLTDTKFYLHNGQFILLKPHRSCRHFINRWSQGECGYWKPTFTSREGSFQEIIPPFHHSVFVSATLSDKTACDWCQKQPRFSPSPPSGWKIRCPYPYLAKRTGRW